MAKSPLPSKLAQYLNITTPEAELQLKAVFAIISDELAVNPKVVIDSFGSFTSKRLNREVKLNGKTFNIDTNVIKFSPFKRLREAVN